MVKEQCASENASNKTSLHKLLCMKLWIIVIYLAVLANCHCFTKLTSLRTGLELTNKLKASKKTTSSYISLLIKDGSSSSQ